MPKVQERQFSASETVHAVVHGNAFKYFIDLVVIFNVLTLGMQVDLASEAGLSELFDLIRHCLIGFYILELLLRLWADGIKGCVWSFHFWVDFVVVVCAAIDAWIFQTVTWLWRSTILRLVRLSHIVGTAEHSKLLKDLWLVLVGLVRALRGLSWLAVVLLFLVYASAVAIRGLVDADAPQEDREARDFDREDIDRCIPGHDCIDEYEYFGSVSRSMLTMMQCVTLDGWASHIVRPLLARKPVPAAFVALFSVLSAYGLLSIAIGVLVWSTVDLARSHMDHESHKAARTDAEIVDLLKEYFLSAMSLEDRPTIDEHSLRDAMSVPEVSAAFNRLELPVKDVEELFEHLDKHHKGEITIQQFEHGLAELKNPSNRFDMACLSATVGGAASFAKVLSMRAGYTSGGLSRLQADLEPAFALLEELSRPEGGMGQVPEVRFRAAGKIKTHLPTLAQRYT